jgi:uncharacterized small protein (DUF1192 family)
MDRTVYRVTLTNHWEDANGFLTYDTSGETTGLSNGSGEELIALYAGSYYEANRDGRWHATRADAYEQVIEKLHERIAVLRQQIDRLRTTKVLNEEVAA